MRDEKNIYSNSRVVQEKFSERNKKTYHCLVWFMAFNATFNNISVILRGQFYW